MDLLEKKCSLKIPEEILLNRSLNDKTRTKINDREIYSYSYLVLEVIMLYFDQKKIAYVSLKLCSKTNWLEGSGKSRKKIAYLVLCWKNLPLYWSNFSKKKTMEDFELECKFVSFTKRVGNNWILGF